MARFIRVCTESPLSYNSEWLSDSTSGALWAVSENSLSLRHFSLTMRHNYSYFSECWFTELKGIIDSWTKICKWSKWYCLTVHTMDWAVSVAKNDESSERENKKSLQQNIYFYLSFEPESYCWSSCVWKAKCGPSSPCEHVGEKRGYQWEPLSVPGVYIRESSQNT